MAVTEKRVVALSALEPGEKGRIAGMTLPGEIRGKLQDMGFAQGSVVECAYRSPFGDPTAYFIKGVLIAVRAEDAKGIWVEPGIRMEMGMQENGVK